MSKKYTHSSGFIIDHILFLGKYYIYTKKCKKSIRTLQGFIARTKTIYSIFELFIARKKDTLLKHFQKWGKLLKTLTKV